MRFVWSSLFLAACSPSPIELLAASDSAERVAGERGPLGADLYEVSAQVRVTERLDYAFVTPTGGTAPYPLVTFVHGGLVDDERYHWMAAHFASRGFAVVLAEHDADLAITQSGNSELAVEDLLSGDLGERVDVDAPWATMGHSLGGVIAAGLWTRDERYQGLALLASFPAGFTPVERRTEGRVLSLWGTDDTGDETAARDGVARFDVPADYGRISGMNHYAWTDEVTEAELARDALSTRPDAETRLDALRVIDTWLDAVLLDDDTATLSLDEGAFENVVWNP
jgi:poly(3-hydroxybutyrate) depolymerase